MPVRGFAPDAGAGQAHRAKAETIDGEIAAEREFSGQRRIELGHLPYSLSQLFTASYG